LFSGAQLGETLCGADNAYLCARAQQGVPFNLVPLQNNVLKPSRPATRSQRAVLQSFSKPPSTCGNQEVPGKTRSPGVTADGAEALSKGQDEERGWGEERMRERARAGDAGRHLLRCATGLAAERGPPAATPHPALTGRPWPGPAPCEEGVEPGRALGAIGCRGVAGAVLSMFLKRSGGLAPQKHPRGDGVCIQRRVWTRYSKMALGAVQRTLTTAEYNAAAGAPSVRPSGPHRGGVRGRAA